MSGAAGMEAQGGKKNVGGQAGMSASGARKSGWRAGTELMQM